MHILVCSCHTKKKYISPLHIGFVSSVNYLQYLTVYPMFICLFTVFVLASTGCWNLETQTLLRLDSDCYYKVMR